MFFLNDSNELQTEKPNRENQIQKEFKNERVPVIAIPNLANKFQLLLPNHCFTY